MKCIECGREVDKEHLVFIEDDGGLCEECAKEVENELEQDIRSRSIEVASIPTQNYKEIIEIRVPVRFYWNPDGDFDGIEFGEFKTKLQGWELDMVHRCLDACSKAITGC